MDRPPWWCLFLPSVAASARVILAETCQPGHSTPRFLAAQRSAVSSRREEVAQRKPFKRFFSGLFRKQRGSGPSGTQGLPGTAGCTNRACLRTFECSIVGGTTNLADPTRRKANFLWKFLCAGTSPSAMRSPVPHRSPPARIFAEQKCLAADKVSQICCSAGRSSDILQTSKAVHTGKRVLP